MAWPSTLTSFGADVINGDTILASHINDIRHAYSALEKSVAAGDSGTLDPGIINDSLGASNYDAAILVNGVYRVGGILDVLASQIKLLTGKGTYKLAPDKSIADLYGLSIVCAADNTITFPNSYDLSKVIKSGVLASRPVNPYSAFPGATFLYYATDNHNLYAYTNSVWSIIGFYPTGSFQNDSLLMQNNSAFIALTPPAGNNLYLVHNNSGWIFAGPPASYNVLQSPSIYDPTTRGFAFYSTIQQCLNNCVNGQTIFIPPGTYTENLSIAYNVTVAELVPGTVTLAGTISITAIGGVTFRIFRISCTLPNADTTVVTIQGPTYVIFIVDNIVLSGAYAHSTILFDTSGNSGNAFIDINNISGSCGGNLTHVLTNQGYCEYKIRGSVYVTQVGAGYNRIVTTTTLTPITYVFGGGLFKSSTYPYTFSADANSKLYVFNVSLPTGVAITATTALALPYSDRVAQTDVQATAGLVYAANNFV
jgi:hypothetical protein